MCMVCQVVYGTTAGVTLLATTGAPVLQTDQLNSLQKLPDTVAEFTVPTFERPAWYKKQVADEKKAQEAAQSNARKATQSATGRTVTYSLSTAGATSSDLGEFSSQVNQTLNDARGWARMGIGFQEVASGGDFNLVLSEASQVPTFSSACSVEWSCRVGVSVIINDARWTGASAAWNASGGSLRDYRHMVVNHEVGHWLGHGHLNCTGVGQVAPVMQQQSIDLQGCTFNPWPLESELWSSQLGIQ